MRYVYGCPKDHRREIEHSMHDDPEVICVECGSVMRRIPQRFSWYINPVDVLYDLSDKRFGEWKAKRKAKRRKKRVVTKYPKRRVNA